MRRQRSVRVAEFHAFVRVEQDGTVRLAIRGGGKTSTRKITDPHATLAETGAALAAEFSTVAQRIENRRATIRAQAEGCTCGEAYGKRDPATAKCAYCTRGVR